MLSDSHDDVENIRKAIHIFNREKVDFVIHCGDYIYPGIISEFQNLNKNIQFIGVLGNNDGEILGISRMFDKINGSLLGEFGQISIDKKIIGIYHGTNEYLRNTIIESKKYDIFVYGHTHIKEKKIIDDTLILNPGSLHKDLQSPDDKLKVPTVVVYDFKSKTADFIQII